MHVECTGSEMTISLLSKYHHKVKTAVELRSLLGAPPRDQKVIMCHGVFDIVHPGHIRHLMYAKSKAPILIASLTADRHIEKGRYRPHVPQDLRALNLAALEPVDYVIIDENATPLENIRTIQPDFFAKGYEYNATGTLGQRTQEELDAVQAYSGELLFTPGDIVYSSTELINVSPPVLKFEKLFTLMDNEGVSFDMLRRTLDRLAGKRVHVVGDAIVDSYTYCMMIGGQTKTPTMSVLFEKKVDFVGGAAIVAQHMMAAGASVVLSTVLGDDALKDVVLDGLAQAGVECRPIIDTTRPTVNKNVIVAGGYHLLKVDTLDNSSITDHVLHQLEGDIRKTNVDAVVFSDFRHGIFNRRTIPPLIEAIPAGCFRAADSQVASRWGNIIEFKGFDLITPNEREARFALGDQDSGIRPLASMLFDRAQCKMMILKLGDRGVLVCRGPDHERHDSFFVMDSFVDHLVDPLGAGDALLAYSILATLATGNDVVAAILGSFAAACECERAGNVMVTPDDVRGKIDDVERHSTGA